MTSLDRSWIVRRRATAGWLALLLGLLTVFALRAAPEPQSEGVLIPVTGAIGPATSDFFVRQLAAAQEAGAHLVVLRIDTPGGE